MTRVGQRQVLKLEIMLSLYCNCFSNIFERHPVVALQNRLECCKKNCEIVETMLLVLSRLLLVTIKQVMV